MILIRLWNIIPTVSQTTWKQGQTKLEATPGKVTFRLRENSLTWLIFEGVAGDVSVMDVRGIPFQRQ